MGTKPSLWTPTGISGESINTWSAMTQPLSAVKANIVLVEGMPSENPNNGHGASDSLTGQGFGYYGQGVIKISVDQFIAKKLVAAGINRPISSLLLGANTSDNGGISQFYGGATGGNLPTIGSPLSAYNTVFGGALPPGMSASALLTRRKSILDLVKAETTTLKGSLGTNEKAKLDVHLDSIRQLENKLNADHARRQRLHEAEHARRRQRHAVHGQPGRLRGERHSPEHHRQRLRLRHHARGVPRVRQRPEVEGQRAGTACPTTISTAASSTAARPATSPTW